MRLMEECPYITPCGWCSRKNEPCKSGLGRMRQEQHSARAKVNEPVIKEAAAEEKEG